jgi:hypothetical protein
MMQNARPESSWHRAHVVFGQSLAVDAAPVAVHSVPHQKGLYAEFAFAICTVGVKSPPNFSLASSEYKRRSPVEELSRFASHRRESAGAV